MGKIGDLWVRLGLKSDDYKKGIDSAKKETNTFSQGLGKMKAGALAVWAAIGTSVIAFGKKMIDTTNAVGDAWNRFTAQARAGWDTFVQSLSAMNWDDFIGRFREATSAAKDLQDALDAEFEISNSIKLQKAAMAEELNALEILARNSSKPYEVRAKAAQDYLNKVRPLYEQEKDLANMLLDAQQGKWLAGSGLSDNEQTRADLSKFLVDYGKTNNGLAGAISRMRELQEQYDMALSVRFRTGNYTQKNPVIEEYRALRDMVGQFAAQNGYGTDIYKLAQVYESLRGDKDTQPLVDALIRAGEAAGAFDRETKRMQMALNTATAALENASESMATAVERQDLSLPAMTAVTGMAVSEMPNTMTSDWLEQQASMYGEAVAQQAEWIDLMAQGAQMFHDSVVSSIVGGMQEITDSIFGLEGADASSILAALMQPFADTAIQFGGMLISTGIGIEAFKDSLKSLRPEIALAAGAALLALGATMKSGIKSLSSGRAGAGSSASYGGSSYASSESLNYESTLTVEVVGKISGSDILIAGQNQQNKWNR